MTDNLPTTGGGSFALTASQTAAAVARQPSDTQPSWESRQLTADEIRSQAIEVETSAPFTDLRHSCPGISPNGMDQLAKWWVRYRQYVLAERAAAIKAKDQADIAATRQLMRQQWGAAHYDDHVRTILEWLKTLPREVRDTLQNCRTADGTALANTRAGLDFLLTQANMDAGEPAVPSGAGAGPARGSVDSEIFAIERMMRDRRSRYWRGPESERLQARYRELIDKRDGR